MAAARLRLAQADAAQQAAQSLLDIAHQQLAAGAVAEDAVLQAEALLLEQRGARLAAEATLVDAERTYQTLTGLAEYPAAPFSEPQSAHTAVGPEHPLLRYLGIAREVAASQADQAREQTRGSPTLSIGVTQQRPDDFNPANDSLVVGLSIPLGGGAAARAQASDAHRQQAAVAAQYADARRTLQLKLHEVEHELEVSHSQLALLERQRELAGRRARMAREAFAVGEYRMDQVVLAEREAQRVNTEYALLTARREQLISEYNQAVGVLP
jgi:outer membrane protein TolC